MLGLCEQTFQMQMIECLFYYHELNLSNNMRYKLKILRNPAAIAALAVNHIVGE